MDGLSPGPIAERKRYQGVSGKAGRDKGITRQEKGPRKSAAKGARKAFDLEGKRRPLKPSLGHSI
jgi:hypothetical protein